MVGFIREISSTTITMLMSSYETLNVQMQDKPISRILVSRLVPPSSSPSTRPEALRWIFRRKTYFMVEETEYRFQTGLGCSHLPVLLSSSRMLMGSFYPIVEPFTDCLTHYQHSRTQSTHVSLKKLGYPPLSFAQ